MGFTDIPEDMKQNYLALAAGRGVTHEVLADELENRDPHLAAWLRSQDAETSAPQAARKAAPKGRSGSVKASTAAAAKKTAAAEKAVTAAAAVAERAAATDPGAGVVDGRTPPEGAES